MYGRSSGSCSNVGSSSSSSRRRRLCLSFYLNFCCSCPMATLLFWGYRPSSACGWQHQRQRDMNERTSTKIEKERKKDEGGKDEETVEKGGLPSHLVLLFSFVTEEDGRPAVKVCRCIWTHNNKTSTRSSSSSSPFGTHPKPFSI